MVYQRVIINQPSAGLVLLSRSLFADSFRIRSKHPFVVVLPGGRNDDLKQLGVIDCAVSVHWLFVRDPLESRWSRKLVTLVQLGASQILPKPLDSGPEWDVTSTTEFSALLSKRLFQSDHDWSSFIAESRSRVPSLLRSLNDDLKSNQFYSWTKLDASTHRVNFRAASSCWNCLLASSGVKVPFCINVVCRDDDSRAVRDKSSAIAWLSKLSYNDALVLIKQLDSHQGLVLSRQSFGIRVSADCMEVARRLVAASDSKYSAANGLPT